MLPHNPSGENYPCIGPQGLMNGNTNGRACSIEMYFPTHALTDNDGKLIPIKWTSFDRGADSYQGELLDKHAAQRKFHSMVEEIKSGKRQLKDDNWDGLRSIINMIMAETAKMSE